MDSTHNNASSGVGGNEDLALFREEWRREIVGRSDNSGQNRTVPQHENAASNENEDVHIKAREYFQQGVQFEECGKLYDAIRFYKKAVNLVPDIEKEAFKYTRQSVNKEQSVSGLTAGECNNRTQKREEPSEETDMQNLVDKFCQATLDSQSDQPLIQPENPSSQSKHIGDLPVELLNYILKWVVSKDLDLRSLESCSQVCRGFYLAARDEEIWRLVCGRVLGSTGLLAKQSDCLYRDFYISKPRVLLNGCYISKMTYIREGERSFQDHESYRAWHMVEYNRLIRFFPGGRMLMCLSSDDHGLVAKLMNNRNFCSIQGSMFGEYRIQDNLVACVLHKTNKKKIAPKFSRKKRRESIMQNDVPDQDYLLEFVIKGSRNRILQWKSYNIVSKYSSGTQRSNTIALNDSNFPRMKFTSVGSYHFESTSPL